MPLQRIEVTANREPLRDLGVGVTHGTDHLLVKMILGYRFKL